MKHTAIYVRVSTDKQDFKSQVPDLKRWEEGHAGTIRWYRDKFTGRTMTRPSMDKLLDDLRTGKLDRVVVWRLDRLGRTTRGLCELFDELRERKVDLVSLRDGFNLNSPSGRMHARILASVAEFESEVRSERIRAGQAAAKKNGKTWGGSEKGRLLKVKQDQIKAICRMKRDGTPIAQIARITGLSRPTVYRVLGNDRVQERFGLVRRP